MYDELMLYLRKADKEPEQKQSRVLCNWGNERCVWIVSISKREGGSRKQADQGMFSSHATCSVHRCMYSFMNEHMHTC